MPVGAIPAITGKLRKRLILDLSVALGGGTALGYAYWCVRAEPECCRSRASICCLLQEGAERQSALGRRDVLLPAPAMPGGLRVARGPRRRTGGQQRAASAAARSAPLLGKRHAARLSAGDVACRCRPCQRCSAPGELPCSLPSAPRRYGVHVPSVKRRDTFYEKLQSDKQ